MKDDIKGIAIIEFGGLKSKMISFTKEDNEGDKKGVNKDVKENES